MEYVFPILHPFYNPSIIEGGRSWLLMMAAKNVGFRNSITSLTSYFFCAIPVLMGSSHQICTSEVWEELPKQAESAFYGAQHNLADFTKHGAEVSVEESVGLLATVVHSLYLEYELPQSGKEKVHLGAAISILNHIVSQHGSSDAESHSIEVVLEQLALPNLMKSFTLSKPELGAFRFYSALTIANDIITSTFLDREPQLAQFLSITDSKADNQVHAGPHFVNIVGVEVWVFLIIARTASLNVNWKRYITRGSSSAKRKLRQQAYEIERDWKSRMDAQSELKDNLPNQQGQNMSTRPLEFVLSSSVSAYGMRSPSPSLTHRITSILAHASLMYLLATLNGGEDRSKEIGTCVSDIVRLLKESSSSAIIRTLT